jgi:hypothetical protein
MRFRLPEMRNAGIFDNGVACAKPWCSGLYALWVSGLPGMRAGREGPENGREKPLPRGTTIRPSVPRQLATIKERKCRAGEGVQMRCSGRDPVGRWK